MTSRNSFWRFSRWNFKKRIWTFVLCWVVWFFVLPVTVFSQAGSMIQFLERAGINEALLGEQTERIIISIMNGAIPGRGLYGVLTAIMGIFLALQGFAWNNYQSRVDMYKSVPVKEAERFWYINFNSLLIFFLSFGVNMVLANISAAVWKVWDGRLLMVSLFSFLMHLLLFISAYFVTLIAQSLTGNIALGFFGSCILMFVEPACYLLKTNIMSLFYDTYAGQGIYDALMKGVFSPVSVYVGLYKSVSRKYEGFVNMGNYGRIWIYIIMFLIQIGIYGGAAYFLYRKRPAQTGGKSMVFPKTKPVVKCVIMILGSLAFGIFMARLDDVHKMWYGLFGVFCGLLILQVILQTIMEGDFKEALKGRLSFGAAAVIAFAVFMVYALDLTGFDRYLPKEEKVESFAFVRPNDYCHDYYDENQLARNAHDYLLDNMRIEDKEAKRLLFAMLKQAIDNDDYYRHDDNVGEEAGKQAVETEGQQGLYEDGTEKEYIWVKFRLADGREVLRNYYLNLERIRSCYYYLYDLPEYKEIVYSILTDHIADEFMDEENDIYAYFRSYPHSLTIKEENTRDFQYVKELLSAIQSDLRNRNSRTIMSQAPVGELNFATHYESVLGGNERSIRISVPVYEDDKETIRILEENGWLYPSHIDKGNIRLMRVYQYYDDSISRKMLEIKPGDELFDGVAEDLCISERLNHVVDIGTFIKNDYYVEVETIDGYGTYSCLFFIDQFPEELEKAFEDVSEEENMLMSAR